MHAYPTLAHTPTCFFTSLTPYYDFYNASRNIWDQYTYDKDKMNYMLQLMTHTEIDASAYLDHKAIVKHI